MTILLPTLYPLGSLDPAQVVSLSGKLFCLLSHLAGTKSIFEEIYFM